MSRQSWVEVIAVMTADGTAVANTTTETIILPDTTLPALTLAQGKAVRGRIFGKYSNTGTPTITFKVRLGGVAGTVIMVTPAITTPSGVTNVPFEIDFVIQQRLDGSSGTVIGYGRATVHSGSAPTVASATGAPAVAPLTAGGATAPATASLDLTASQALSVTATWSAASASNTLTAQVAIIEIPN